MELLNQSGELLFPGEHEGQEVVNGTENPLNLAKKSTHYQSNLKNDEDMRHTNASLSIKIFIFNIYSFLPDRGLGPIDQLLTTFHEGWLPRQHPLPSYLHKVIFFRQGQYTKKDSDIEF